MSTEPSIKILVEKGDAVKCKHGTAGQLSLLLTLVRNVPGKWILYIRKPQVPGTQGHGTSLHSTEAMKIKSHASESKQKSWSLPYLLKTFRKTQEKILYYVTCAFIFFIDRVQAQSIELISWEKYTKAHLQAKSFYSRTNAPCFPPKLNFQLVLFEQEKKTRNVSDKGKVGQSKSQQLTEPRMAQRGVSGS